MAVICFGQSSPRRAFRAPVIGRYPLGCHLGDNRSLDSQRRRRATRPDGKVDARDRRLIGGIPRRQTMSPRQCRSRSRTPFMRATRKLLPRASDRCRTSSSNRRADGANTSARAHLPLLVGSRSAALLAQGQPPNCGENLQGFRVQKPFTSWPHKANVNIQRTTVQHSEKRGVRTGPKRPSTGT